MNQQRITQLLDYYQQDPHDPFNLYALAMEYVAEQPAQAQHYFERLLTEHPQYLPTYYHAAQLYVQQDEPQKAVALYDLGLRLAREQKQQKTFDELNRAYRALLDDLDE